MITQTDELSETTYSKLEHQVSLYMNEILHSAVYYGFTVKDQATIVNLHIAKDSGCSITLHGIHSNVHNCNILPYYNKVRQAYYVSSVIMFKFPKDELAASPELLAAFFAGNCISYYCKIIANHATLTKMRHIPLNYYTYF